MEMVRTGATGNWEENTEDMSGWCGRFLGAGDRGARQVTWQVWCQVGGTGHSQEVSPLPTKNWNSWGRQRCEGGGLGQALMSTGQTGPERSRG